MEFSFKNLYKYLKDYDIIEAYVGLLKNNIIDISEEKIIKLLSIAALLIEREELEYQKLAYYIILKYSILTEDYTPLYDISYKLFNIPVIELLDKINNITNKESIIENLYDIVKESFKENNIYYTAKQKKLKYDFFQEDVETAVVAPTSFGKTELIKEYVFKNYTNKNICIILPSKAMINQLRLDIFEMFKNIKNIKNKPRIIVHYDVNIKNNKRNIFIFTQERLFKFLYDRKNKINFDTLLIDEAHNLFENDSRNKLLARIIILLKNTYNNIIIKYFSPVIEDYKNINFKYLKNSYHINKSLISKPIIKIEEIEYISFSDKKNKIYDPFFNQFITTEKIYSDEYEYILKKGKNKNIIYLNKPKECLERAFQLASRLHETKSMERFAKELQDYIHKDYDLAFLIKKGIIYHSGIVPENVRLYLENIIKKNYNNIKYIFATSTLLEGVNMPFDTMFIMDIYKGKGTMSYHDLKNLIGRVNRYSNIFNKANTDIQKLLPKIHFIQTNSKNNFENFIQKNLKIYSNENSRKDILKNPLLNNVVAKNEDENEHTIIKNLENDININEKIKTEVGKYCLENNVTEFNIHENENIMQDIIDNIRISLKKYTITELIYSIFIEKVQFIKNDYELLRLENSKARAFYEQFIGFKKNNIAYNEMIKNLINYWETIKLKYLYIGSKWGECKRSDEDKLSNYINLTLKTDSEKVNYAIKKIKIENDFIDYKLMKYIEILFKLKLIDKDEFNKIKYGTSNELQIYFQMEGLSQELSQKIITEYSNYIIPKPNGEYEIDKNILDVFCHNDILKTELEYFVN